MNGNQPASSPPTPVEAARRTLSDSRKAVNDLLVQVQADDAALAALERNLGVQDERLEPARRRLRESEAALAGARGRTAAADGKLNEIIKGLLDRGMEGDVARLSADFPIVMLPVRIETRFKTSDGASQLWLRVYPDEIVADLHEPELTQQELDLGTAYWTTAWSPDQEPDAWRAITIATTAQRAAWIVKRTTPGNLPERPAGAPAIPDDVPLRTHSWTRAAEAHLLPDRWLAIAYRGGKEVRRALSGPVKEPLALTLSPTADPATVLDVSGDGLQLDPEILWTVDFPQAEAVGMALRMPLQPEDMRAGFDRLLVLGVKSTLAPLDAADRLAALFDSHHYTRGLALVPQGTPTNNTSAAPSAFPPPDPGGAASYPVERGPALARADSDGGRFAAALGVPIDIAAHVAGAERDEQKPARAMARALWPVTWGYYIETLLAPASKSFDLDAYRDFFVDRVRARGQYPTFRIGNTPYGILPVSSLDRWRSSRNDGNVDNVGEIERTLAPRLLKARSLWLEQVNRAPRTGASSDPDADLLAVLGMDASTREVRIRQVLGADLAVNLWRFLGLDPATLSQNWNAMGLQVAQLLGVDPASAEIFFKLYKDAAPRFNHPFVVDGPLSETAALNPNYIARLRTASLRSLRLELEDGPRTALLYLLLRHATLDVLQRVADGLLIQANVETVAIKREPQLVKVAGVAAATTVWERLDAPLPAVSGAKPLGEFLLATDIPQGQQIAEHRQALQDLENLPTAELERLLTETLDVCSHRIDAWITALPARRLADLRAANPLGSHLGAFAWVEDLRPRPPAGRRNVQLSRLGTVEEQVDSGGHVLAPSMLHAAAAAILRNGYLTRSGEERSRYAVDLSSARVRQAQFLLDAVRNGQALGAVLGYQFERGLHEGHRPLRLDKYKEPFRNLYPLPTNTSSQPDEPQEAIAARDVVDGMKLHDAWKAGAIPWGQPGSGLPAAGADRDAIEAELGLLHDAVDAASDLLLAEAVYQIVRGSMPGAAATLDSMARGIRPPDPEIAHLARGGSTLTHRVALVVGGEPIPNVWPGIPPTARSLAEPRLDAWAGTVLGDPAAVKCRVSYLDPTPGDPAHRTEIEVTLADLRIRPLDLLALARAVTTGQGFGEVDQRVGYVALQAAPEETDLQILYDRGTGAGWERDAVRTFPEILEVARTLNDLLGGASPLRPADLLPADSASLASGADTLPAEAASRVQDALDALTGRRDDLINALAVLEPPPAGPFDLQPLRDALIALGGYGFTGALPATAKGNTEPLRAQLAAQGQDVREQANRRLADAAAAPDASARVAALFGRDFVFLPRFRPAGAGELANAVAAGPSLVSGPHDVPKWFQAAARVRPALGRWRTLALYSGALGSPVPAFEPAQLPFTAGARWAALDFADEEHRHPSGLLSLDLARASQPAATDPWAGLLVDEWTEVIANADEAGAVAFHYDSPGAEAPQAVLVAVPPVRTDQWDLDSLIATLNETLDLAKIRAVDGELLTKLSELLPAIYLTANTAGDAITTKFSGALATEAVIVARGT